MHKRNGDFSIHSHLSLKHSHFHTPSRMLVVSFALILAAVCTGCGGKTADTALATGKAVSGAGSSAANSSSDVSPSSAVSSENASAASSAVSSAVSSAAPATPPAPQGTAKRTVCIDPGHQIKVDMTQEPEAPCSSIMKEQNPGGAEGIVTKTPEYKLNLAVSLKIQQQLVAQGYNVVMTRTTNDVNIGNIDRAKIANNCNADLFVRIHADGVDDQSVHGISILIPGSEFVTDATIRAESRKAAQAVMDGMIASTGAKRRDIVERNDMTGFNWCTRPMMLVEMGFMSNPDEDNLMSTDAYQQKLATGIVNGINQYFAAK